MATIIIHLVPDAKRAATACIECRALAHPRDLHLFYFKHRLIKMLTFYWALYFSLQDELYRCTLAACLLIDMTCIDVASCLPMDL
ncbi:hypothetical protein DUNSADRAFT_6461 [Dunaliella salina]|uniref:Encoded protein n=1 Tax=Dunaliella salina TaxID=3046 RepID=A0ABQ7GNB4_DUNSA|nr:hypothetical protein DUNSADRAFT_6461 [Dunaliella salina]|eukprot:KAF5836090.1 hypothetical protein DUNSADRAFT_6461 [Dunaliella salina]